MKSYSIGEIAKKTGITASTIRFYDRHGLLPFVKRDEHGNRQFTDDSLNYLEVITVLKKSGVPVDVIGQFITMCMAGDTTLNQRYDYLREEERRLDDKIQELNEQKEFLKFKQWYYQTAIEAGTESIHFLPGTKNFDPHTKQEYYEQNQVSPQFKKFLK